ncbi:hypothetical protein JCM24511_03579 [Saitozyma sp. JCM 24511]|nr:hypothetical protein JCM24511_03579 [Saitozyma sp. JCM 24511]
MIAQPQTTYNTDFLNLDSINSSPNPNPLPTPNMSTSPQQQQQQAPEQAQAGMPNPDPILRAIYSWLPSYTTACPFPAYGQVPASVMPTNNGLVNVNQVPMSYNPYPAFVPAFPPKISINTSVPPASTEASSVSCANPLDIFGGTSPVSMQKTLSSSLPMTNGFADMMSGMPIKSLDTRRISAPATLDFNPVAPRPALQELPPQAMPPQATTGRKVIPRKRTRIANACERCRIRKARCFGGDPCHRCSKRGLTCEFVPHRPREHKKASIENSPESSTSASARKAGSGSNKRLASSLSDVEESPSLADAVPLARSQSDDQGYTKSAPAPAPIPVPVHATPESTSSSSSAIHTPPAQPGSPSSVLGLDLGVDLGSLGGDNMNLASPSAQIPVPSISVETPSSCADSSVGWDSNLPTFDWSNTNVMQPTSQEMSRDLDFYSSMMEDHMLPFTLLSSLQPNQANQYDTQTQSQSQSYAQPFVNYNDKSVDMSSMYPYPTDWLNMPAPSVPQMYGTGAGFA